MYKTIPFQPDTLMVRARCRRHVEQLQERFPALAALQITATPDRDHVFRLIIAKRVAALLFDLAAEQQWSNFKIEAAARLGGAGREYIEALHQVSATMARLQDRRDGRGCAARSSDGVIVNAQDLTASDLANQRVLCPCCGGKAFVSWPEGWDGHAGWACTIEGATPEDRKQNYKRRYKTLFR